MTEPRTYELHVDHYNFCGKCAEATHYIKARSAREAKRILRSRYKEPDSLDIRKVRVSDTSIEERRNRPLPGTPEGETDRYGRGPA